MKVFERHKTVGVKAALVSLLTFPIFAHALTEITAESFSEGLASVCVGHEPQTCSYIDQLGRVAFTVKVKYASEFHDGFALVTIDGKDTFVDKTGKMMKQRFDRAYSFSEGFALVEVAGKYGFIDGLGKFTIEPKFDHASDFNESLASVSLGGKYGFIDLRGNLAIPASFDGADVFHEGLAAVKVGEKWGFIDKIGTFIVEPKYAKPSYFSNGMASVEFSPELCAHSGFIDRSGVLVIEPKFPCQNSAFHEELVAVNDGTRYGYANKAGRMVIPIQFDQAGDFHEGLAAVWVNHKAGYIDSSGRYVIQPSYEVTNKFIDGIALVSTKDRERGYINKDNQWVIPPETVRAAVSDAIETIALKKSEAVVQFRKTLRQGDETNCGPIIELKGKLIKVYTPVKDYGNEHWIRISEIYPRGYDCTFVNGQYDYRPIE